MEIIRTCLSSVGCADERRHAVGFKLIFFVCRYLKFLATCYGFAFQIILQTGIVYFKYDFIITHIKLFFGCERKRFARFIQKRNVFLINGYAFACCIMNKLQLHGRVVCQYSLKRLHFSRNRYSLFAVCIHDFGIYFVKLDFRNFADRR